MRVVLRIGPYTFFFSSLENNEPPHIHIRRDRTQAKFWMEPMSLAYNGGRPLHEVRHLVRLVEEHRELPLRSWQIPSPPAPVIEFNCDAMDGTFDDYMLRVHLVDGREIAVPFDYFPRLRDATPPNAPNGRSSAAATASTGKNSTRTSPFAASSTYTKSRAGRIEACQNTPPSLSPQ